MERPVKKRLHNFFDEKPSWDGKKCKNHGIFLVVRHILSGAAFLGDSHIPAIGYIGMRTRPICIIANGPFSRNGLWRYANTSTTPQMWSSRKSPSPGGAWEGGGFEDHQDPT
jgi:hypothetical protein